MEQKIKCSAVEEQWKKKETEGEKEKTVKVKRPRKVEGSENREGDKIGVLKRIAEVLEGIMVGQQELIEVVGEVSEEQRGMRLAMEVWMRRQEEKEQKWEKGKGKEKEKESDAEKTDEEENGEEDGEGDKDMENGNGGEDEDHRMEDGDEGATSLAVCIPLYTLLIIHIPPSFYFTYIHLLLFGYHLNLSCSQ